MRLGGKSMPTFSVSSMAYVNLIPMPHLDGPGNVARCMWLVTLPATPKKWKVGLVS